MDRDVDIAHAGLSDSAIFVDLVDICFKDERRICEGFRLNLPRGESVILKAPNGWGKTVLLRFLSGWSGEYYQLRVNGRFFFEELCYEFPRDALAYGQHARRRIACMFHRLSEECFGVTLGEEISQIRLRYETAIGYVPLCVAEIFERLKDIDPRTPIDSVAKGLRQILAVVDVFADIARRNVIVLDEPSSYLAHDMVGRLHKIFNWSKSVNASLALIIATHDKRLQWPEAQVIAPAAGRARGSRSVLVDVAAAVLARSMPPEPIGCLIAGHPVTREGRLPMRFQLELQPGASLLVSGRNGAGKSSLLLTIGGLYGVAGKYTIRSSAGKRLSRRNIFRRYAGILFQEPQEYEFRTTVSEVLSAGCWLPAEMVDPWEGFIQSFLDKYDIPASQDPRTLSSGQLRMVWMMSMLGWCSTWLLDEPTASLDGDSIALAEQLIAVHVAWGGSVIASGAHSHADKFSNLRVLLGGGSPCAIIDLDEATGTSCA